MENILDLRIHLILSTRVPTAVESSSGDRRTSDRRTDPKMSCITDRIEIKMISRVLNCVHRFCEWSSVEKCEERGERWADLVF